MIITAKEINGIISLIISPNQKESSKKCVFFSIILLILIDQITILGQNHANLDLTIFRALSSIIYSKICFPVDFMIFLEMHVAFLIES